MRIRFQADADLDARIIRGLKRRQPEIDFQTAEQAGLRGLGDPDVLRSAADSGRILVTHDRRTMPGHWRAFIANRSKPGRDRGSQADPGWPGRRGVVVDLGRQRG